MTHDFVGAQDSAAFGLSAAQPVGDGMMVHGTYRMECVGPDGAVKWVEDFPNLVVTAGKNDMETQYLKGSAYTAAWYMGLKNTGTALAADTMASHSSWTENTTYTGSTNRATITWGSASGGVIATGTTAFAINGTTTIFGCFITTVAATSPGNTGTLFSAADAGASRSVISGDTLNVTYTLTLT